MATKSKSSARTKTAKTAKPGKAVKGTRKKSARIKKTVSASKSLSKKSQGKKTQAKKLSRFGAIRSSVSNFTSKRLKRSGGKGGKATGKRETIFKFDLRPMYVPMAILFSGLMVSCAIVIAFGDPDKIPFLSQEELECDSEDPLSKDCLKQYARDVDLDYGDFKNCLNDEKYDDVIAKEMDAAEEYDVQGTPFVVIGEGSGDTFKGFYAGGAQGYEYYQNLIEKVKANGLEKAHESFVAEQFGSLEELTARYEEAYAQSGYSGDELKQLAKTQAEEDYARLQIREFSIGDGITIGEDDAQLVLMSFMDFECSYCQSFAENTLPQVRENYIDNGQMKYVFRDLPLESIHTSARKAANAARCANEQDKFEEFLDKLYLIDSEE